MTNEAALYWSLPIIISPHQAKGENCSVGSSVSQDDWWVSMMHCPCHAPHCLPWTPGHVLGGCLPWPGLTYRWMCALWCEGSRIVIESISRGRRRGDQNTCDLVTQSASTNIDSVYREGKMAKTLATSSLKSSTSLLIRSGGKGNRTKHCWPCRSSRWRGEGIIRIYR